MSTPRPLFLALLLTPILAAAAGTPTRSTAELANEPGTVDGPAAILRAQILLDRARFGPGEIDAQAGSNLRRALRGFQAAHGLTASGKLEADTWSALNTDTAPALIAYTLTSGDVAGPYVDIPKDMMAMSKLKSMGYGSLGEALGEKFHASPELLKRLNPGADFGKAGTVLQVPNVADLPPLPKAAKLMVDKSDSTVTLLDANGKTMAQFPASSGSQHDPLPIGQWQIKALAPDPTFHYNPELFWDSDPTHAKATIAAGPNNPVGRIWIDLSKPHYGIHGTPMPSTIGKTQSHGCVRLSNWDALAVAAAVGTSVPVVMQE